MRAEAEQRVYEKLNQKMDDFLELGDHIVITPPKMISSKLMKTQLSNVLLPTYSTKSKSLRLERVPARTELQIVIENRMQQCML